MPLHMQGGYKPPKRQKPDRRKKEKRKTKRLSAVMLTSVIVLIAAAVISAGIIGIWRYTERYKNAFFPGLYLDGHPLEGMTAEEGASLLQSLTDGRIADGKAVLTWKGNAFTLTSEDIRLHVDVEDTLGPLWRIGRDGGMIQRFIQLWQAGSTRREAEIAVRYDEQPIHEMLARAVEMIDRPPVDAIATFDPRLDTPFSFTEESEGYRLETDALRSGIATAIAALESFETVLDPEILEPEICRSELENAISLRASVQGRLDSGNALLNERLALTGLERKMIAPEEVFSFNREIGMRTEEAGYETAPEPAYGLFSEGVGGGVCRISSMLYEAALRAGLKVEERHAAVYPVPYCEAGLEATVSDQGLDLRIRNDTGMPLWIQTRYWEEADGSYAAIEMIGLPLTAEYGVETRLETGETPDEPIYIRDKDGKYAVYTDERVKGSDALPEIRAITEISVTDKNGIEIRRELVSDNVYEGIPMRIYVGSKQRPE